MKRKLIFFLALFEIASLLAQSTDVDIVIEAQGFFEKSYYKESLEILTTYEKNNPLSSRGLFLKALNLYQLNRLTIAEENFSGLIKEGQQAPFAEVWLYLGKIHHHQHEFEEAAKYYKAYLRLIEKDEELKKSIVEEIRRCSNGRREKYRISGNFVENFGNHVNSNEEEFFPVESGKGSSRVYFSAMSGKNTGGKREETGKINEWEGRFYSDMYQTTSSSGKWVSPNSLHFLLNSPQHEVLIGFDSEEQNMYFFRGNNLVGGEIMSTSYSGTENLGNNSSSFFTSPWLNIKEGGFQVCHQTMVLFAARIPGGFGGLDLYYSIFSEGKWSSPINLGPEINSAYDEAYPFLSSDGKTLFYSTNNSDWSLGGYDIVHQSYDKEQNKWLPVISMGMPINSAGDDIQFYLARDGYTGYFASNRRTGYGKKDLYVSYLGNSIGGEKSSYPSFAKKPEKTIVIQEDSKVTANKEEEVLESLPIKTALKSESTFQEEERSVLKADVVAENEELKESREVERNNEGGEKKEEELPTMNYKNNEVKSLELPIVLGSIELGTAEYLKVISREYPKKQNGYVHLTFSVRSKVPLYEHYRQVEQSANQVVQYLIALGFPSNRIAFRINLNSTIPSEKFHLQYSWKDGEGLPLESLRTYSEDPFSIKMMERPFYYKVSLNGASELKNAALINNYSNPTLEVSPEGKVSFNAGQFRTYEAAISFAQQLINNGLTELRVIPYVYDYKASDKSIAQFMHLFSDFSIYLNQKR